MGTSILALAVCLCLFGCGEVRELKIANVQRQAYAMHGSELAHVRYLQTWAIASVNVAGSADVYVDGGKVLADRGKLVLPVGTHEFRAVWPDGKQAHRKIYCPPVLGDVEWEWKHIAAYDYYEVKVAPKGPDLKDRRQITRVELQHP